MIKQTPVAFINDGDLHWHEHVLTTYMPELEGKDLYIEPPIKPEQDIGVGIDVTEFGTQLVVRRGNEIIQSEFYHAPKRDWVSLTDEEIDRYRSGYQSGRIGTFVELTRAIEAKLKERNT